MEIARFTRIKSARLCCSNRQSTAVKPPTARALPYMLSYGVPNFLEVVLRHVAIVQFQCKLKLSNIKPLSEYLSYISEAHTMEKEIISKCKDGKKRRLYLRYCENCKEPYYGSTHNKLKFCSLTCAQPGRESVEVTCVYCKTTFKKFKSNLKKSKSGLRFCSRVCKNKAQSIDDGNCSAIQPEHYGTSELKYRKIAFRHHPARCNRCGYNRHIPVLRVHHIDRNRKNGKPENLEILCPTCHEEEHYTAHDGMYTNLKSGGPGEIRTLVGTVQACSPPAERRAH